jgi:hypothetical protein
VSEIRVHHVPRSAVTSMSPSTRTVRKMLGVAVLYWCGRAPLPLYQDNTGGRVWAMKLASSTDPAYDGADDLFYGPVHQGRIPG